MTSIQNTGISSTQLASLLSPQKSGQADDSFKNLLLESLNQVNTMQHDADHAIESLLTGEEINPADVLTTVQKADMSFRMMQQIRNKLVQAYQEIKEIRI